MKADHHPPRHGEGDPAKHGGGGFPPGATSKRRAPSTALRAVPLPLQGRFWAALLSISPAPAIADTLVDNVDGLTLDETGRIERFTGLLIGDDGKVKQLLRRGDKRPAKVDYQVDGKGRVAMPGFIDSHIRLMDLGLSTLTLDLSPARSLAEAQARIAAWAQAHPDKPWILGSGWNAESWGLGRQPTAAEIDAVAGGRPVWLIDADGAVGWANGAALAAAGITAATRDPAGGRIDRIAGTAKPSGTLTGNALALVARAAPAPRPEDRDVALVAAQQKLLERGITAIADMGTTIEDWQSYRRAGDAGTLRIRIMAYADGTDAMALIGGPGPSPWLYDDRLRLNGVLLRADGALASRGAQLKAAYADAPGSGFARLGEAQLRNLMSRAAIDNFQIAVQAAGDAASAAAVAGFAELAQTYKGDRRWRIEGLDVIDPADAAAIGQGAAVASMQPARVANDRTTFENRLGPARLAGAQAWRMLAGAGATLAFGSGAPGPVPDVFAGLAAATTRQDADGAPYGGWQAQERLDRESALAAYTAGGARAGFAEARFGRLGRGLRADFILVDRDPLLATPAELRAAKVLEVWINGRPAWRDGQRHKISKSDQSTASKKAPPPRP